VRDLPKIVAQSKVGQTYKMDIWRDGRKKTVRIKTERFPEDDELAGSSGSPEPEPEVEQDSMLGAELSSLSDAVRSRYRIGEDVNGVVVTAIERGGLAFDNNLAVGDVIVREIGKDQDFENPEDLIAAIEAAQKSDKSQIVLLVNRRGVPNIRVFNLD
ncbi:MAG: hypothetical protein AAF709_25725, partial [Pseudomonadota bacterium]